MIEELQQAVDSGKLTFSAGELLEKLVPGAFCQHKSWGFGRIAEWSLITGQIIIDFKGKKGHPMQVQYAAETLLAIPADHILAQKFVDAAAVRQRAETDPVGLVRQIVGNLGGKATVEQLTSSLCPEVFDATGAKKWWESAKKKLKADGHFQIPAKKTDFIVLSEAPVAPGKGLIERFRGARYLKEQIAALDQITKGLDDLAHEVDELQRLAAQIEDAAHKGRKLQAAQAIELLLARDEIIGRHDALQQGEGAPIVADILKSEEQRLPTLFLALPAAKHRRVLEEFKTAFEDRWIDKTLKLSQESGTRLVVEIYRLFEKEGELEKLRATLAKWISERSLSSDMLIWLCRERGAAFPELFNSDLLASVFSSLERDQLAEKRSSRLHDLMMDDRELLGDLLADAEIDVVRDSMRKLLLTPVFDNLNKRSLLARIIKMYPEMQSMVSGDEGEKEETLTVSWSSLEKRKAEYEHLINKEIPQNTKDISIARSYGDLRENFEFKSAKEQQRVLLRRKMESERDLGQARGTNFENPDTAQVSIGTIITLRTEDGGTETYSILGAWDSAPELGIVSYKAAIGQAALGKKVGEKIELPTEFGTRFAVLEKIEPFKNLELLRQKVHVLASLES